MNRRQFLKSAGIAAGALAVAPAVVLEAERVIEDAPFKFGNAFGGAFTIGVDVTTGSDFSVGEVFFYLPTAGWKYVGPCDPSAVATNLYVDKGNDVL